MMVIVILIVSAALIGVVLKKYGADNPQSNLDNKEQLLIWLKTHKSLNEESILQMQGLNYVMLQNHLLEQNIISQSELDILSNPYVHSGVDLVVDHDYHGINNGLGSDDHKDSFSNNDIFGGGFNNFGGDSNNSGNNF